MSTCDGRHSLVGWRGGLIWFFVSVLNRGVLHDLILTGIYIREHKEGEAIDYYMFS